MIIPRLLYREQIGAWIVGEGDTNRVGKREDDKYNHARHTRKDVTMGIGLLVHEDIQAGGYHHQIQQREYPLATGIHHHGCVAVEDGNQGRYGPLEPDVLIFLRTGIGLNRRYYFHAN